MSIAGLGLTLVALAGCSPSFHTAPGLGSSSVSGALPETAPALNCAIAFDEPFEEVASVPFSTRQQAVVREACRQWSAVWSSEAFKRRVLGATFTQTEQVYARDIYLTITGPNPRNHLSYSLTSNSQGSETARTDAPTGVTRIQEGYLDGTCTTFFDLANTFSHEYTHTREDGAYTHNFLSWWPPFSHRELSVPYQIGEITEAVARTMFKEELVTKFQPAASQRP